MTVTSLFTSRSPGALFETEKINRRRKTFFVSDNASTFKNSHCISGARHRRPRR